MTATPALLYSSHTLLVRSLYRRALKTSRHWAFHHHLWRPMALAIRQEFDEKKNESNPITIQKYIKEAEEELDEWRHPDPYNQPHFIGGSKWERNLPPPPELCNDSSLSDFGDEDLIWVDSKGMRAPTQKKAVEEAH